MQYLNKQCVSGTILVFGTNSLNRCKFELSVTIHNILIMYSQKFMSSDSERVALFTLHSKVLLTFPLNMLCTCFHFQ